jgi:RNA polymerase sigma factor (TIGR02999 family)
MRVDMGDAESAAGPYSADILFAEVYDRLKAIAARQRGGGNAALATTELVHELYLRMASGGDKRFEQPVQFFAYAARAMRHILIDAARAQLLLKAGGDRVRVSLTDPLMDQVGVDPTLALQLDDALRALEHDDPRAARVVELHYFAGLELERIAELLGLNVRTIDRDWRYARAFLAARSER